MPLSARSRELADEALAGGACRLQPRIGGLHRVSSLLSGTYQPFLPSYDPSGDTPVL